ncbi:hypothetical protein N9934_04070 [Desulfosarcina sp.]|nr:hypothetical protein [Desulfosarcina sp.]
MNDQKITHISAWHTIMGNLIKENERDFEAHREAILAEDENAGTVSMGHEAFLEQYEELLEFLRPVFEDIFVGNEGAIDRRMRRMRKEVKAIARERYGMSVYLSCAEEEQSVQKLYALIRTTLTGTVKTFKKGMVSDAKESMVALIEQRNEVFANCVYRLYGSFERMNQYRFEAIYHDMCRDVYNFTLMQLLNACLGTRKIGDIHTMINLVVDAVQENANEEEAKAEDEENGDEGDKVTHKFLHIIKEAFEVGYMPDSVFGATRHIMDLRMEAINARKAMGTTTHFERHQGRMKWVIDIYCDWIRRVILAEMPRACVDSKAFLAVVQPLVDELDAIIDSAEDEDFLARFEEIDNEMILALRRLYYPERIERPEENLAVFTAA